MLNYIPLAALAAVLLMVGYKLTPPKLYVEVWRMGRDQFLPFITTVLAILATDLLTGTLLGHRVRAVLHRSRSLQLGHRRHR